MADLMSLSVAWINLPFTLALVLVVLYWLSMILGVVHDSHSDIDGHADVDGGVHHDMDAHAHADAHADASADAHGDAHADAHGDADHEAAGMGATGIVLRFLHADEVPLTAVLSVLTVCLWAATILGNWYLNPRLALGPALLLLGPELLIAAVATRFILIPAAPLLGRMNSGVARKAVLVGQVATVKSEEVTERTGQAELMMKGVSLLLNVRTTSGARLSKGDAALITAHDEARGIYEVTKM